MIALPSLTRCIRCKSASDVKCCACSLYVNGLDIFELKLTVGTKAAIYVRNNDANIPPSSDGLPGLGVAFHDVDAGLYGVSFATDDLSMPGRSN